jgi:FkbM family methyltransferase
MPFIINDKKNRNVLVSCDHGLMLLNRFDCNEIQGGQGQWLLDHGNVSTLEANCCINELLNIEEPVIFDVGANIGTFTTWMAKYFTKGKVYSFEPQRSVFQLLTSNIALNNLYNGYTYNFAIGKEKKILEFQEPDYFSNVDYGIFSLVEKKIPTTEEKISVIQYDLDSFVIDFKIEKVNLIKIDVEGMDLDVLNGAENTIKKFRPVIFVEHCDTRKTIANEIEDFFKNKNYALSIIENNILAKPIL